MMRARNRTWFRVAAGFLGCALSATVAAQPPGKDQPPAKAGGVDKAPPPRPAIDSPPGTILAPNEFPIDLETALRLAGAENPELLLARQRIVEATAIKQLAAAQILPNLNVGTNYDSHTGTLQQSNGNILKVDRDSLYLGLGAAAVGSGTVNIPGLNYNLNVGVAWYGFLSTRQRVTTAGAVADAARNDVLLRVCLGYTDLLRSEGRRAIAVQNRTEAVELARLTAVYANTGQGRRADADRAAVELRKRDIELTQAEADILLATARLCQLLNLDPSTRLRPIDGWVVPAPLVPDPIPLPELLAISLMQRPELAARRSEVQQMLYELSLARVLPFSPNVILGFSAGGFGGGGNLTSRPEGFIDGSGRLITAPRFSDLDSRTDFDVVVFWTFRNLGVGNVALIRAADSRVRQTRLREMETINLVRSQVAESHARVAARFLQIDSAEKAVRSSTEAFSEDLTRIKGGQGLPLEVIDSLRLLGRSRYEYLDTIIDYNRAQFQLWVSLGRPPANALARPVPADLVPPPIVELKPGPRVMPMPRVLPLPVKP
ncbi:MAG: TolC family protein [Planctomycetes bacterium]|nr:TolC family protein [Planctomycetota bacterium]